MRAPEINPILVNVNWPIHDQGGYGQLAKFVNARTLDYRAVRMAEDNGSPRSGTSTSQDTATQMYRMIGFNARILREERRRQILHLLYGESIFAPPLNSKFLKRCTLVTTLHLPVPERPSRWVDEVRSRTCQMSEGIIVLSSDQVAQTARRYSDSQVAFIPHGIDIDTYANFRTPKSRKPKFVTIGSNLRDWDSFEEIVGMFESENLDFQIDLIGAPASVKRRWSSNPWVRVLPRLSSSEYRRTISSSWGVVLPLTAATANNAVLEAHALGTKVIASDLPGVRDYAIRSTKTFTNAREAFREIQATAAMTPLELEMEAAAAEQDARRFDWDAIAKLTSDFYLKVSQ